MFMISLFPFFTTWCFPFSTVANYFITWRQQSNFMSQEHLHFKSNSKTYKLIWNFPQCDAWSRQFVLLLNVTAWKIIASKFLAAVKESKKFCYCTFCSLLIKVIHEVLQMITVKWPLLWVSLVNFVNFWFATTLQKNWVPCSEVRKPGLAAWQVAASCWKQKELKRILLRCSFGKKNSFNKKTVFFKKARTDNEPWRNSTPSDG